MYNPEVVQPTMKSYGFQASVCPWSSLLAAIWFPNKEERAMCWVKRCELLHYWFDDLEFSEGFDEEFEDDRLFIGSEASSGWREEEENGVSLSDHGLNDRFYETPTFEDHVMQNEAAEFNIVELDVAIKDTHSHAFRINVPSGREVELHEVPIMSAGSFENGVVVGSVVDSGLDKCGESSDELSISNGNLFRAVNASSLGAKRGRPMALRAWCDKFNWWVSRSFGKHRVNKKSKMTNSNLHVCSGSTLYLLGSIPLKFQAVLLSPNRVQDSDADEATNTL
ncbi:hypothetical protein V6N12_058590 [Hibiscus sabdariffa]|uniref:Uncharacterized protein n=1 Tax=Hibiscus sabdariffa TaxID=183260 RepID=A0ABR2ESL4_9ROSI